MTPYEIVKIRHPVIENTEAGIIDGNPADINGILPDGVLLRLHAGITEPVESAYHADSGLYAAVKAKRPRHMPDPAAIVAGTAEPLQHLCETVKLRGEHYVTSTRQQTLVMLAIIDELLPLHKAETIDDYYAALSNAIAWMNGSLRIDMRVAFFARIVDQHGLETVPKFMGRPFDDLLADVGGIDSPATRAIVQVVYNRTEFDAAVLPTTTYRADKLLDLAGGKPESECRTS